LRGRNVSNIRDIKCLTHFRREVAAVNERFELRGD
jgi:hypothetical protein